MARSLTSRGMPSLLQSRPMRSALYFCASSSPRSMRLVWRETELMSTGPRRTFNPASVASWLVVSRANILSGAACPVSPTQAISASPPLRAGPILRSITSTLASVSALAMASIGSAALSRRAGPRVCDMTFKFSPIRIILPPYFSLRFPGLEIGGQGRGLPRAAHDFPAGGPPLPAAAFRGDVAGDDELAVLDLGVDAALLDGRGDNIGGEFAGRPGGHDRKPLGVLDIEVAGHLAVIDLAGDEE